jgi:hypothetical protein
VQLSALPALPKGLRAMTKMNAWTPQSLETPILGKPNPWKTQSLGKPNPWETLSLGNETRTAGHGGRKVQLSALPALPKGLRAMTKMNAAQQKAAADLAKVLHPEHKNRVDLTSSHHSCCTPHPGVQHLV